VVHAGAEQPQAAFAAQGIVAGQEDGAVGSEASDEEAGQGTADIVQRPGVVGEEAMEAGPVTQTDRTGGEEALGDGAVAAGEGLVGEDEDKEFEGRGGEGGAKVL
jgi:hypothetical protein